MLCAHMVDADLRDAIDAPHPDDMAADYQLKIARRSSMRSPNSDSEAAIELS